MAERSRRRERRGRRRARRPVRLETSAGGVVFRRDDAELQFLLIRDPYDNWGLPKGHVERGETAAQAALREVGEETGLTRLRLVEDLPTIDWFFREQDDLIHKYCHFFLMEAEHGEARPQVEEGITDCIWLPLDDAIRTLTYDNARLVLERARERLVGSADPR